MNARRFYAPGTLERDVRAAGLRIRARHERSLLAGRSLVVAGWVLERDA
jgi:hypothetical protein